MTKAFWATAIGLSLLAFAPAKATDIRNHGGGFKDDGVEYVPVNTWAGFYLGGNVGGVSTSTSRNSYADTPIGSAAFHFELKDQDAQAIGGFHLGYNWQSGNLVLGGELDTSFSDNIDYLTTLRVRAGIAMGNVLIYGTGGAAFTNIHDRGVLFVGGNAFGYDGENKATGWVAGGGAEVKVTPNLSLGAEALYHAFSDVDFKYTGYGIDYQSTRDTDYTVVRGRLTWHLTPPRPARIK